MTSLNDDKPKPYHKYPDLSSSALNAPSKTPSTIATSSSSIDYKTKSPTSSTSPSTYGYLNSSMSPPPRVPPPPPTQESGLMDVTLTLQDPINSLDSIQYAINLLASSLVILFQWKLLEHHGNSCLYCIHNRTLIFGLRDEIQYMLSCIEHMLS
ncbi:hypothetical protein Tco_1376814 [Tanacetum coccineum]